VSAAAEEEEWLVLYSLGGGNVAAARSRVGERLGDILVDLLVGLTTRGISFGMVEVVAEW